MVEKSQKLGFGYVCYKKYLKEKREAFFLKNQMTIYDFVEVEDESNIK